jgi:hypothetical protein
MATETNMIEIAEARVQSAASTASYIASLCALVGEALGADPATTIAAEAVEGLGEMAQTLSRALFDMAPGGAA